MALSTWTPTPPVPANALTPAAATVIFPGVFSKANAPLNDAKPETSILAVPSNLFSAVPSTNFTNTSPCGVLIVSSTAAPVVFARAATVPLKLKPLTPTKLAVPAASNAYEVPAGFLYNTAPNFPPLICTPVFPFPKNASICVPPNLIFVVSPLVSFSNANDPDSVVNPPILNDTSPANRRIGSAVRYFTGIKLLSNAGIFTSKLRPN